MNIYKTGKFLNISNKYWELRVTKLIKPCYNFIISYTTTGDHAGFDFKMNLWKLNIRICIYDNRQWNWNKNTWNT